MTQRIENFNSLKAHEGESVSFGDGNKEYIIRIKKIGNNLNEAINDAYFIDGLNSAC